MSSEIKILHKEEKTKLNLTKGVPPLTSLYIYVTGSCNLACKHCWIEPEFQRNTGNGKFIDLEDVRKAVKEAKPLGLRNVKLTGGEPLLHPEIYNLIDIIANEGINITIETNGTLIDKKMAKFLKKSDMVSFISVSIDGSDAKTHDDLRGVMGSFDLAVSAINNLVETGYRPQMICSLHRDNFKQAEDVIHMAAKLGCGSVKFNHIQKIGRGEKFADDNGLEVAEILEQSKYLEKNIAPKVDILIHYGIPMAFFSIKRLQSRSMGRCTVKNILGILSDGNISLCGIGTSVPELLYGNIKTDSLVEVWTKSPGLLELRDVIPGELKGICGECIHKNVCLGSCIANNYFRTNELNAPYEFCFQAEKLNLFPESRKIQKSKEDIDEWK